MSKKIQGVQTTQPFPFTAKDIIQEPDIRFLTNTYTIGEKDFNILTQGDWIDWLKLIAYASLGIFLTQIYKFVAFIYQILKGSQEEVTQLKKNQGQEIENIVITVILSLGIIVLFFIINRVYQPPKKKLLKKIRQKLDESPSVIASKRKGTTCD
jgi:hypothetical protein